MATKKEITKEISAKKKTQNKKVNTKINKIIYAVVSMLILLGVIILSLTLTEKEKIVITIDNIEYTESDFNMYAYLIKYEYFGIDGTDLDENTLNTQVSNDKNQTVREYLKEKTISKIKISASILRIADENNITLNKTDEKEIETELSEFIQKLGGKDKFKTMLKKNRTTTDSYLKVARVEKLYDKVYESLYTEGKRNDLTEEEKLEYKESYQNEYVKIKQVILLKKNLDTNKYLDEITLNQKEALAKQIVNLAKTEGTNFDNLIEKYSDGYKNKIESEYYLKSSLVEELKDAINVLNVGDISEVVSTDNAYHIVIREKLDEAKLDEYYNSKRDAKLIEDIADNLDKIAIIKEAYLEDVTVK